MHIKTMAAAIVEEIYPIAVACLPPEFATLGIDSVKDAYLLINVPTADYDQENNMVVVLTNVWQSREAFDKEYEWVDLGGEIRGTFGEVVKMHDSDVQEPTSMTAIKYRHSRPYRASNMRG